MMRKCLGYNKGSKKSINKWYIIIIAVIIMIIGIFVIDILRLPMVNASYTNDNIVLYIDSVENDCNEVTESTEGNNIFFSVLLGELERGIYTVKIYYDCTSNDNYGEIKHSDAGAYAVYSDKIYLNQLTDEKTSTIWVNSHLDLVNLNIMYCGNGSLKIDRVDISTTKNSSIYLIFRFIFFFGIVIGGISFIYISKQKQYDTFVIISLIGIIIISSMGLFVKYSFGGHDLGYHLLRIEGLKDGLLSGQFPVRNHPNWCNGWGYAVPIFYGDTTLLLPSLLRIIGFDVQTSYKCYILFINAATTLISYYSFKKMCKNKYIALVCCMSYTLAPYRLMDIYVRAAFGEYAAMTFFPMIALGFWYAFVEKLEVKDYSRKWIAPVIGFCGVIQSHIISCEIIAFFVIILCVINIKKVMNKTIFFYLSGIVGITILLNLWFLIPMLSYSNQELLVFALGDEIAGIQNRGITVAELLAPLACGNDGFYWSGIVAIGNKPSIALGTVFVAMLIITIIQCYSRKLINKKTVYSLFALSILSISMATIYFPYNIIGNFGGIYNQLLGTLEFPYRILGMSSLITSCLMCVVLMDISRQKKGDKKLRKILILLACLSIFQGTQYVYTMLLNRGWIQTIYAEESLDTGNLVGAEFLYSNSNFETPFYDNFVHGYGTEIVSYTKEGNTIVVNCNSTNQDNAFIEVPMYYYPGYVAYNESNQELLKIERGTENRIRVYIPKMRNETVIIRFKEPMLWRLSEIITLISAIVLILLYFKMNRKNREVVQ